MPHTIREQRIMTAAQIIARHRLRSEHSSRCMCDEHWSTRHVAEKLDKAGCLGPYPDHEPQEIPE